jgi:hypothetical protein
MLSRGNAFALVRMLLSIAGLQPEPQLVTEEVFRVALPSEMMLEVSDRERCLVAGTAMPTPTQGHRHNTILKWRPGRPTMPLLCARKHVMTLRGDIHSHTRVHSLHTHTVNRVRPRGEYFTTMVISQAHHNK